VKDENMGVGHCGKYCPDWVCDIEPKWDDLCVGCPCNEEENDCGEDGESYEEDEEEW